MAKLVERILKGDVRAAARLMRLIDDDLPEARRALDTLFPHTGKARIIGMTGNPGSGKSTLVDQLITKLRARGQTVGCIAVDPTSPFSGGAILGDRVRMQEHAADAGVFIRSVATRGNLGGISRSTPAMLQILDAMGFDVIIVETVGVGQAEVDIVRLADTSIVIMVPGLGDDVQASKAGLLEIADIFVVNKADRDGHQRVMRELRTMLNLAPDHEATSWRPPILKTVAPRGEGLDELLEHLDAHHDWLRERELLAELDRARVEHYTRLMAQGELERRLAEAMHSEAWSEVAQRLATRQCGPDEGVHALLDLLVDEDGD